MQVGRADCSDGKLRQSLGGNLHHRRGKAFFLGLCGSGVRTVLMVIAFSC